MLTSLGGEGKDSRLGGAGFLGIRNGSLSLVQGVWEGEAIFKFIHRGLVLVRDHDQSSGRVATIKVSGRKTHSLP